MSDLLRSGLQFLRQQFEKGAGQPIRCCLVEYPVLGTIPDVLPPVVWLAGDSKWERQTFYRDPTFAEDSTLPRLQSAGAKRVLYVSGDARVRNDFVRIAAEAGKVVADFDLTTLPAPIPEPTIRTTDNLLRWCYFLFDLAWANVRGSPLTADEKRVWQGTQTWPLENLPALRRGNEYDWSKPLAEWAAQIPDPPSWYSAMGDLWRASVYTTDILLAAIADGRRGQNSPAADVVKQESDDPMNGQPGVLTTDQSAAQRARLAWGDGFNLLAGRLNAILARCEPQLRIPAGPPSNGATLLKAAKELVYWLDKLSIPQLAGENRIRPWTLGCVNSRGNPPIFINVDMATGALASEMNDTGVDQVLQFLSSQKWDRQRWNDQIVLFVNDYAEQWRLFLRGLNREPADVKPAGGPLVRAPAEQRPQVGPALPNSERVAESDVDRFNWVSAATALEISRLGADLVEQLAHRPTEDALAFTVRQSAAQSAWRLERLVNVRRYSHTDRRRGRSGKPVAVVTAITLLSDRLGELYDLLAWQEVCTDADGPDAERESGHERRPWWLPGDGRQANTNLRPPDVPAEMLASLRVAVTELARATKYGYDDAAVATRADDVLRRLETPSKSHSLKSGKARKKEVPTHSDDFRSVKWHGEVYTFTENQAARVKVLWENWERGTPDVGRRILLDAAEDSSGQHIAHVFRDCPAWNRIIVSVKKGSYRLQEPCIPTRPMKKPSPRKKIQRRAQKRK